MAAIKQRFQKWFEANRDWLQQKNCVEWGYSRKKNGFQTTEMLVVALTADGLTAALPIIPTATLAAMIILVGERYLDNLCAECAKE